MMTICMLKLKQINGNICFLNENHLEKCAEKELDVKMKVFDDSYAGSEVIDEILEEQPDGILVDCGIGTVRYAARLVASLNKHSEYKIKFFFISNELESDTCIYLDDLEINIITNIKEIKSEKDYKRRNICYGELPVLNDDGYKDALLNGLIAFLTGCYPHGILKGENKHIKFDTLEEFKKNSKNLKMNLNSSVILWKEPYSPEKYEEALKEYDVWSHFIFIDEVGNVVFDNKDIATRILQKTMEDYVFRIDAELQNTVTVVAIKSKEDYLAFSELLRRFFQKGELDIYNYYIIDECRFWKNCMAKKLYRGHVLNGMLYPCIDMCKSIGAVKDNRNKKIAKFNLFEKGKEIVCNMISDEEKESYIELLYCFPIMQEYLNYRNIIQILKKSSSIISTANKVLIPNHIFSILYDGPIGKNYEDIKVNLFCVDGEFYILNQSGNSFFKLDKKLALIVEGFIKGANRKDIVEALALFCHVEICVAEELMKKGELMLKEKGLLRI